MQDCCAELALTRKLHQTVQYPASDAFSAPLAQHRHPADLNVIAVSHHPAASDGSVTIESKDMGRAGVLIIQYNGFRHTLLLDKNPPAQDPRLFHRGRIADFDHLYRGA